MYMEDVTKQRLIDEIERLHSTLGGLDPCTAEYEKVNDQLVKLRKVLNEGDRAYLDYDVQKEKIQYEDEASRRKEELDKEEMRKTSRREWVRIGVEVGVTVITTVVYSIFANKGFKLEETGSYTSTTLREALKHIRIGKKV